MSTNEITKLLLSMKDDDVADFTSRTIPNIGRDTIIGIKTPELKAIAKRFFGTKTAEEFMADLPHKHFEEDQVHVFMLSLIKDFDACITETEKFLPYINNWATCDQFNPKVFSKHKEEVRKYSLKWMKSDKTYTIRFGILNLMRYFLKEDFDINLVCRVVEVKSQEYYVNMMIAWYLATALAYRYDDILPILTEKQLDPWIHNKTIRKACESFRITKEQKDELKLLVIKLK